MVDGVESTTTQKKTKKPPKDLESTVFTAHPCGPQARITELQSAPPSLKRFVVSGDCGEVIPEPFWEYCSEWANRLVFEGTEIFYGGKRERWWLWIGGRGGRTFGAGLKLAYPYKHTLKIDIYIYIYFLVLFLPKAWKQWHSSGNELWMALELLGEVANSRARERKVPGWSGMSCYARKCSK